MKKNLKMLLMAAVMATVFAFAFSGQAKAQEVKSLGAVKAYGASYDLYENLVGLHFDSDGYYKEVQLLDKSFNVLETQKCIVYTSFDLSKNKVYYLQARYVDDYGNPLTNWGTKLAITTAKFKLKLKKGKVVFKAPKVKGVKSYKVYLSKSSDKGFKKIKTVKPGKSFSTRKFKGKKFKKFKNYYYKIVANTSKGAKAKSVVRYFYLY